MNLGKGYKSLVGGSLGELEHAVMLEQYSGKQVAGELAPHWRGCTFEILESRKAGRAVLQYAVDWDDEDAARRYYVAYRTQLTKKWKLIQIGSESADVVNGTGDDGRFELRRTGTRVTSVEGLPPTIN